MVLQSTMEHNDNDEQWQSTMEHAMMTMMNSSLVCYINPAFFLFFATQVPSWHVWAISDSSNRLASSTLLCLSFLKPRCQAGPIQHIQECDGNLWVDCKPGHLQAATHGPSCTSKPPHGCRPSACAAWNWAHWAKHLPTSLFGGCDVPEVQSLWCGPDRLTFLYQPLLWPHCISSWSQCLATPSSCFHWGSSRPTQDEEPKLHLDQSLESQADARKFHASDYEIWT